jgi:hypothetical protein
MRWRCSTVNAPRRCGPLVLAALVLAACGSAPPQAEVAGLYRHDGPVDATLEVRPDGGRYLVRLEGGGADAAGAATAADCVIEARGALADGTLRAAFGAVESDTFSYGAAQAAEEGRTVEIHFAPGVAEVVAADTVGYCGWGADLTGRYVAAP